MDWLPLVYMITDRLGRVIRYLRLSLTPACNLRCLYCCAEAPGRGAAAALIRADEIENLVRHLVGAHGLSKVRLTGGEATLRQDLLDIVRRLARIQRLGELVLTSNGLTLARHAAALAQAGVRRINVSLDSLNAARFRRMSGVDGVDRVLLGIDAARRAGLPVKLNTVVVRGENDSELPALLRFASQEQLEIRFIELMPMGPLAGRWHRDYVPEQEIRQRLSDIVRDWCPQPKGCGAAGRYQVTLQDGRRAVIGFISPISCSFCAACDRLRVASDGTLYPCLMDRPGANLLSAFRPRFHTGELDRLLWEGVSAKKAEHPACGHTAMVQLGG